MPTELLRETEKEVLYRHAFTGHERDEVGLTVMDDLDCTVLFAVDRDVKRVVEDHYPEAHYMAAMASVWRHLHRRGTPGGGCARLYACFHDRQLDIFSYGQNRFKFCNAFDGRDAHDALYYMLYVWKLLGFEPNRDELFLLGDVPEGQWLAEEVRKYVQRVRTASPAADLNLSAAVEGMPFDLTTLFTRER